MVVSLYASAIGSSATLDALFCRLKDALGREAALGRELLALQGALDSLLAAASTGSGEAVLPAPAAMGMGMGMDAEAEAAGGYGYGVYAMGGAGGY